MFINLLNGIDAQPDYKCSKRPNVASIFREYFQKNLAIFETTKKYNENWGKKRGCENKERIANANQNKSKKQCALKTHASRRESQSASFTDIV